MEKSDKPDNESSADEPEIDDESSEGSAEESLRERIEKGVQLTPSDEKRMKRHKKKHDKSMKRMRLMRSKSNEVFMDPLPEDTKVDKFSPKKDPQLSEQVKIKVETQEEIDGSMRCTYNKVRKKELEAEMEKVRKTKGSRKELEKLRNQYAGVREEILKFEYRNHSPNEIDEVIRRDRRRLVLQKMEEDIEDEKSQETGQISENMASYYSIGIGLVILGIILFFIKVLS